MASADASGDPIARESHQLLQVAADAEAFRARSKSPDPFFCGQTATRKLRASVVIGQLISRAKGKATFLDTLGKRVCWATFVLFGQIRKVCRVSHPRQESFVVVLLEKVDSDQLASKLCVFRAVETEHSNGSLSFRRPGLNSSIFKDLDRPVQQARTRVWHAAFALGKIAAGARIHQVVVFAHSVRVLFLWQPMVDMPIATPWAPFFSAETINTAKKEFVSKPLAIWLVRCIASRPVSSNVR